VSNASSRGAKGEVFLTLQIDFISTPNVTTTIQQSIVPNKYNLQKECKALSAPWKSRKEISEK